MAPAVLGPLSSAASGAAGLGIAALLGALASAVAGAAGRILSELAGLLGRAATTSTTPDLGAGWFLQNYRAMVMVAATVLGPVLVLAAVQAVLRQDAGMLARVLVVQVPLAVLLTYVAVQVVSLGLGATDELCSWFVGQDGGDAAAFLRRLDSDLGAMGTSPSQAGAAFLLIFMAVFVLVGGFLLWLELVVRSAAIYASVFFLPLALATMAWPAATRWARRLGETLGALVFSKLVVVAVLCLAAEAVTSDAGLSAVVGGLALLVIAVAAPYVLLRLVPVAEVALATQLEGLGRRAASGGIATGRELLAVVAAAGGGSGLEVAGPVAGAKPLIAMMPPTTTEDPRPVIPALAAPAPDTDRRPGAGSAEAAGAAGA